jgi:SsrA-binding protein
MAVRSIKNRRALHDYFVIQKYEAGIVLVGSEIKSIREGNVNFRDSYAKIVDNEIWLISLHISPWEKSSFFNHDPSRKRKLLMHRQEIRRLKIKVDEQGMTLVPLEVLVNDKGLCKVILGLCKGKKEHDKRETLQMKDLEREKQRDNS